MIQAVKDISYINPEKCRNHAEQNFSIERETRNYIELYKHIINN